MANIKVGDKVQVHHSGTPFEWSDPYKVREVLDGGKLLKLDDGTSFGYMVKSSDVRIKNSSFQNGQEKAKLEIQNKLANAGMKLENKWYVFVQKNPTKPGKEFAYDDEKTAREIAKEFKQKHGHDTGFYVEVYQK